MNRPPPRFPGAPPEPAPDDLSIPVLTERLGLTPLDFDTTLPLIEPTGQMNEPMLEGLTALPDAPQPYLPPPHASTANLHPIAALPFPPIVFPDEAAPVAPAKPFAPPPAAVAASALPPILPLAPPPPAAANLVTTGVAASPAAAGGQHWGRIEMELRSSILRQITEQLPREIDSIVQGRMQEAIDRLLVKLAEEIHLAVTASLADIVERAVRAELDRMRNSNRG
jgi:hypothetical protein